MAARLTAYLVAFIVGITLIAGLIVGAQRDDDGPVDLIVVNGQVYTADHERTTAEAVAIQGNKILRVGSNTEIRRLRRAQTVVIDAKGGAVLPGFNDAHTHLLNGGLSLTQLNLRGARSIDEISERVREWAVAHPNQAWITGRGWQYEPFTGGLPTRQMLDELVPDRPAFVVAYDGHTAWANTQALKLAGITRRTPNPVNGLIVKDARTGEPTGVLKEAAMNLVATHVPKPARPDQLKALRSAIVEAHRYGITSVHTASGSADEVALLEELRREGRLDLRVYAGLSAGATLSAEQLEEFEALRTKYPDDPLLKTGAVKIVADGVVETHTAALLEPYADKPATAGEPRIDQATLDRLIGELDKRGWQVLVHAIGDRTVRMALDAIEKAIAANPAPVRGRRHRVEHIELVDDGDARRFARTGTIASVQPAHALPDPEEMGVWTTRVGDARAERGWALGRIARSGGRLAFGSDWPVAAMNPLLGLHVAVNRTTPEGEPAGGWLPNERLSLPQAIDAYTRDAAWASFDEHRKGSLARDMLADLVILSKDVLALPASQLLSAEVTLTIFDGKVVYQRSTETN